jgi:ATP-dependent DNA helicase RecG
VAAGRQAFVVCPLIDPSDTFGAKSAKETFERLKKDVLPKLKIGLLHGRLKAAEKEKVMTDFLEKKIDVLVATAVIEVGIDVPNATVMVIEGAERFGLAQLHQFRGRVGRSNFQSCCFAISQSGFVPDRLRAFAACTDGFELAERDLELRGPGERYGVRQSGLDDLRFATLTDAALLSETQEVARALMAVDPTLGTVPLLAALVRHHEERVHLE